MIRYLGCSSNLLLFVPSNLYNFIFQILMLENIHNHSFYSVREWYTFGKFSFAFSKLDERSWFTLAFDLAQVQTWFTGVIRIKKLSIWDIYKKGRLHMHLSCFR